MSPASAPRRAVLIFADNLRRDLARRALPLAAAPLLAPQAYDGLRADVHLFIRGGGTVAQPTNVHAQRGRNFAHRLENAIHALQALGYEQIVAVGRDCPALVASDIARAFDQLARHRLVLGPDHRGGCYLIAFRATDADLLRGVRWKCNTDCAQLRARCVPSEVFLLPIKHDLDSWADVRLIAAVGDLAGRMAAFLLAIFATARRAVLQFVDLTAQAVRVRQQMPPPLPAAI